MPSSYSGGYCLHLPNIDQASWLCRISQGLEPSRKGKVFQANNILMALLKWPEQL